ncbi:MAG TPA: transporter [Candidatus Sulfobium mesophilum]|nr:transporter [Candidatus Sulfobium mesophilum]
MGKTWKQALKIIFQVAHELYRVMVGKRLIARHVLGVCLTLLGLLVAGAQVYAQEQETDVPDPCSGLLAILDRPTVSTSPCATPRGQFMLEMGFQRSKPRDPASGTIDNYPQAEVRIGLPGRNEFTIIPPSYNRQRTRSGSDSTAETVSGYSALTLGLKHELGYTRQWLGAVQALFTLPSGSSALGSEGLGVALNGVVSYALSEQVGLTLQLGISSQTDPELAGGERFTAFVSNLVVTWQPKERLQFYGEIYGQSSTGPGKGAGYNADGGIQYLITPYWEVDLEGGVRLVGDLGGLSHFFGMGMGFRF